jgi:hypothetical protein
MSTFRYFFYCLLKYFLTSSSGKVKNQNQNMLLFPSPGPGVSVTVDLIKKIRKNAVRSSVAHAVVDESGHFQPLPDDDSADEV